MRADNQFSSIKALANEMRDEISLLEEETKIAASAYDTAWVAMVEDPKGQSGRPMFGECLEWILRNQREEGFWGDYDDNGIPKLSTLTNTLACVCALKKWNLGSTNINKGLAYVVGNTHRLLEIHSEKHFPLWFAIIFPGMVEFATVEVGLHIPFSPLLKTALVDLSYQRQQILEGFNSDKKEGYPPLDYLEALPLSSDLSEEELINKHLSLDGSLSQSPSATARAFMLTGNKNCLSYLRSVVENCPNGVTAMYPMDSDLIKLTIVNEIQRMGLAEHFGFYIDAALKQVHNNYMNQRDESGTMGSINATSLYKDSLAFRLLRMHGFSISPQTFCCFKNGEEFKEHVKKNHYHFWNIMLSIYRATDLTFPGEIELEEARSFSENLIQKNSFRKTIKHELSQPWIARMEHLDHRFWIQHHTFDTLSVAKADHFRCSRSFIYKLRQLAQKNFEFRQSVYQQELDELQRWTKEKGLADLGFARDKTAYCYFALSASTSLPYDSTIRKILTKSAILVVVVDDFFDVGGSLEELQLLTNALKTWDSKGLSGHSKTLFDALDDLVTYISQQLGAEKSDKVDSIRFIWYETLVSWLKEAVWAKQGVVPSMDEYLENARVSVAIHTMALPASCLLNPSIPIEKMKPTNYDALTKLLMTSCRLLNDFRGYQREQEEGKLNSVLLNLRENPTTDIKDSVSYIQGIIETTRKEFLKHALMVGQSDLPEPCKRLHLSCLRFYEMFYNSANRFDSETDLLQDIQEAIYLPLHVERPKQSVPVLEPDLHPLKSSYSPIYMPKKSQGIKFQLNLRCQRTNVSTFQASALRISIGFKVGTAATSIQMPMFHKPSFV